MATSVDPVLWGAAGGVLIKLIDFVIARTSAKTDDAAKLRSDLIAETRSLRHELDVRTKENERLEDLMNERDVSYGRLMIQIERLEASCTGKDAEILRLEREVRRLANLKDRRSIDER
jgi:hypothetical protein